MNPEINLDHLVNGGPKYEPYIIYEGVHWTLYLNAWDQLFLGRSYVWLIGRHEDNMPFDALTHSELDELIEIMCRYRKAVERAWGAVRVNAAWLGNEVRHHAGHGHMHLVPRYETPPKFLDTTFVDPDPEKNFGGFSRFLLPHSDLLKVRDEIRAHFS